MVLWHFGPRASLPAPTLPGPLRIRRETSPRRITSRVTHPRRFVLTSQNIEAAFGPTGAMRVRMTADLHSSHSRRIEVVCMAAPAVCLGLGGDTNRPRKRVGRRSPPWSSRHCPLRSCLGEAGVTTRTEPLSTQGYALTVAWRMRAISSGARFPLLVQRIASSSWSWSE